MNKRLNKEDPEGVHKGGDPVKVGSPEGVHKGGDPLKVGSPEGVHKKGSFEKEFANFYIDVTASK